MEHDELGAYLRSRRDRLRPADAGLPAGGTRRAPGLRREEVAQLAGLSVDYLARLEQGRATHPSPSVLGPLARALRLSDDERAHLYRIAGQADPAPGRIGTHVTPGVQRVLDRLADVPVLVLDAAWRVVAANALAVALLGEVPPDPTGAQNIAWSLFMVPEDRIHRSAEEKASFERSVSADLRHALGRYPHDETLQRLVADLRAGSPRFAALWEEGVVAERSQEEKTFLHPTIGRITLACDTLTVTGSDLRLVIYTAEPDSPDAWALALLQTVGLQSFPEARAPGR